MQQPSLSLKPLLPSSLETCAAGSGGSALRPPPHRRAFDQLSRGCGESPALTNFSPKRLKKGAAAPDCQVATLMSQGTKVCGLSWVLQERQVSTLAHQNLTEVYTVVLTEVSPKHSPGGLKDKYSLKAARLK